MSKTRNTNPFLKLSSSVDVIYNQLAKYNEKKDLAKLACVSQKTRVSTNNTLMMRNHLQPYLELLKAFALHKDIQGQTESHLNKDEKNESKQFPDAKAINAILARNDILLIDRLKNLFKALHEPLQIYITKARQLVESLNLIDTPSFPQPLTILLQLQPFIQGMDKHCNDLLSYINLRLHFQFHELIFGEDDDQLSIDDLNRDEKIFTMLSNLGGINAKDEEGTTLLMKLCKEKTYENDEEKKDIPFIRTLLKNGADVNTQNHRGETPLLFAINAKSLKVCWLLLTHGAKFDNILIDQTPLLIRLSKEKEYHQFLESLLPYLVFHHANINISDQHGNTALIHAAIQGNDDIVQALLNSGADINAVNKNGETALMKAILRAKLFDNGEITSTIRLLLASKADVLVKDKKGKTALDYAELHPELLGCLKDQFALVPYAAPGFKI